MAVFERLALAFALVAALWAQSATATKVWSVVGYINHGDRTPLVDAPDTVLTPEGAQQMLRQGKAFRARYLANISDSDYDHIGVARVEGLDADVVDNTVLDILSRTDQYINGGAVAFLQGLYPPSFKAYENSSDNWDIAHDYTDSNDTLVDYPLNGYQYANIRTYGILDPTSTNIQGNLRCSAWETATTENLTESATMQELYNVTYSLYQAWFSSSPLEGLVDLEDANLWNAYEIYDLVNYMYIHNETVYEGLSGDTDILDFLNSYATTMERAKNAYIGGATNSQLIEEYDVLYSVAGRTLSNRVATQLINNVQWSGERDKMALMFGSYEPILAFTAMASLLNSTTAEDDGPFATLPEPGAAMVFELIGEDEDDPDSMPTFDKLSVRFLYRAGADTDEDFVVYPLFGLDNGTIAFASFVQIMQDFGVSSYDWCDVCGPNPAPWCSDSYSSADDPASSDGLDPVVAGVLGAIIMAAVVAVSALLLFCLFGVRLQRKQPRAADEQPPTSTVSAAAAGGFKGAERKGEDKDVAVARNGVHHERVGSWELKDGTTLPSVEAVGVTAEPSPREERRRSFDDDGDDISVMGATPVKAHESV